MMKRFFLSFLAIAFPWLIFVLEGRLELAVLGMFLQASVIGWIPISIIAWKHRKALGLTVKGEKTPEQAEASELSNPEQPHEDKPE